MRFCLYYPDALENGLGVALRESKEDFRYVLISHSTQHRTCIQSKVLWAATTTIDGVGVLVTISS